MKDALYMFSVICVTITVETPNARKFKLFVALPSLPVLFFSKEQRTAQKPGQDTMAKMLWQKRCRN